MRLHFFILTGNDYQVFDYLLSLSVHLLTDDCEAFYSRSKEDKSVSSIVEYRAPS